MGVAPGMDPDAEGRWVAHNAGAAARDAEFVRHSIAMWERLGRAVVAAQRGNSSSFENHMGWARMENANAMIALNGREPSNYPDLLKRISEGIPAEWSQALAAFLNVTTWRGA
ncbi:hypothetical protein ACQEVF_59680 [Nonomuraea polychroma]|uniref:hypothetical protein n=1 Tax=Nonomuraea polychroma TaxID=46176 RepID=UPI003D8AF195